MNDIVVEQINGRMIAIKGIGKMFFQDGFPISMSVSELKQKGIEVSIFHVADECIKNGWSAKTTFNKLVSDFEDDVSGSFFDKEMVRLFCFSSYDTQRAMIFKYLFGNTEEARKWFTRKTIG
jgi:hypothetical protein